MEASLGGFVGCALGRFGGQCDGHTVWRVYSSTFVGTSRSPKGKGQGLCYLKDSELNSARRRPGEDRVAPPTTGKECRVGVSLVLVVVGGERRAAGPGVKRHGPHSM